MNDPIGRREAGAAVAAAPAAARPGFGVVGLGSARINLLHGWYFCILCMRIPRLLGGLAGIAVRFLLSACLGVQHGVNIQLVFWHGVELSNARLYMRVKVTRQRKLPGTQPWGLR